MHITAVSKRRGGLFGLYCGDECVAVLDRQTLAESGIVVGSQVDEPMLLELTALSNRRRAKTRALYMIARRDYSRGELEKKLGRVVDPAAAQSAAERMEELGLVDDGKYAERLAQDLLVRKCFAPGRALYELRRRGLPEETAQNALDSVEYDPQEGMAQLVSRRYMRGDGADIGFRRAFSALQRLGWRAEEILPVLRKLFSEQEHDFE